MVARSGATRARTWGDTLRMFELARKSQLLAAHIVSPLSSTVPLGDVRRNFGLRELPHHGTKVLVLLAQLEHLDLSGAYLTFT